MRIGKLNVPDPIEQKTVEGPAATNELTSSAGVGNTGDSLESCDSKEQISSAFISAENSLGMHNFVSTRDDDPSRQAIGPTESKRDKDGDD